MYRWISGDFHLFLIFAKNKDDSGKSLSKIL